MERVAEQGDSLQIATSQEGEAPADSGLERSLLFERLGPRDNLSEWISPRQGIWKGPVEILAWSVPFVWLVVVLKTRNLRLWTRTLLAAAILAVLKGFFAWVTIVPDAAGWEACKERLRPWVLGHYQSSGGVSMVS